MADQLILAEYGRAKTVNFHLVEVDGVDFRVDAADGGTDISISKDEGADTATTNDFVDEGIGYSVVLTATELQAARVHAHIVDSATKVWLDTGFYIETYGHPSSAHPNLSSAWVNGAVAAAGQTSTVFEVDGFTEATDDHLIGGILVFTSGVNAGQAREIQDYDDTAGTQTVTVFSAYIAAPADNDEFIVIPRPDRGEIWDEILTGATHNIATSAGRRLRGIQEFQGYEGGAVWIDTVNGATGTTDFEFGTVEQPVKTIGEANTIAASLNLHIFEIESGSTVTLAAAQNNQVFRGTNWTLALGGQDVAGTTFIGASVSGVMAGTGNRQQFIDCVVSATSIIKGTHFITCEIANTLTVVEAGDFFFMRCGSSIAGTATWVFEFGDAIGNTNLNMRDYSGGVQLESMGDTGTDTASIEGQGQIIEGTCAGGAVSVRGAFSISGITNITFTEDARWNTSQLTATLNDFDPAVDTVDAGKISGDSDAADKLEAAMEGVVLGAAATGTLSTTQMTTDLTGFANDRLIGRLVTWRVGSAALAGESSLITDYASASGLLTFDAITVAPTNLDPFVIH